MARRVGDLRLERVPAGHRASSDGHRRWAGTTLVVAILVVVRAVSLTFASGCGPSPGEAGGECKDNGCRLVCNEGLTCDTARNRCVSGSPDTPWPPFCSQRDDPACGSGQKGFSCPTGVTPDVSEGECTFVSSEDGSYCCTPRLTPDCVVESRSQCGAPSITHHCKLSANAPGDAGCVEIGRATFCCTEADACFPGPSDALEGPCASPAATTLYCVGSAEPPTTCVQAALHYAGKGSRGYCCDGDADAGER
jgi:hypothetical protein